MKTRRTGAIRRMISVVFGSILPDDDDYGLSVDCYVCRAAHNSFGFARVQTAKPNPDDLLFKCCATRRGAP
jgi:hypothetical protein